MKIVDNLNEMDKISYNYYTYVIRDILNRNTGCTVYSQHLGREIRLKMLASEYIGKPLGIHFVDGGDMKTDVIKHIERQENRLSIVTERHIWLLEINENK